MNKRQMLDQAEREYHDLLVGLKARVVIDQNGERIEYTSANSNRLLRYIEQLRMDLQGRSHPGPARVFF